MNCFNIDLCQEAKLTPQAQPIGVSLFFTTDLLQCMLGGVQCRLDSSVERVRRMGMVVGECISRRLDTTALQLKFQ
ncbi:telomere length regulation protein TEL2 homolog, partial [Tachysurus ichikawai]